MARLLTDGAHRERDAERRSDGPRHGPQRGCYPPTRSFISCDGRPCFDGSTPAESRVMTWDSEGRIFTPHLGPRPVRVVRDSAPKIHRAGCAFVHRLRKPFASALRLPRTAPRSDLDLVALRARCGYRQPEKTKGPTLRAFRE